MTAGRLLAGALLALSAVSVTETSSSPAAAGAAALPPIKHVWIIMVENQNYASTFGSPRDDPYLAKTLPAQGALLTKYYATGHESNDNYLSIVSGQPPNPATQSDCQLYAGFPGGSVHNGIETGAGCLYPPSIRNIGVELTRHDLTWKAYEQDMGNDPTREAAACGHPKRNSRDRTQVAEAGDGYATRHDPFVYFAAVINYPNYCAHRVVALGNTHGVMPESAGKGETGLVTDLKSAKTTPTYSFITPNLCRDGHDDPCKNQKGAGSSLANIDVFLHTWVPKIKRSPAYKQGGLIEVTLDESDGAQSDSSACCGEGPGPVAPLPGISGPGGGRTGTVLISPFIKPGTTTSVPYNHYSTLATDEKLFGLPRLGEARTVTSTFGSDIFTAYRR